MIHQYLLPPQRLKDLPLHQNQTSICPPPLFLKAKPIRIVLLILSTSHNNTRSTDNIKRTTLTLAREASCSVAMKSQTPRHPHPHPLQAMLHLTPSPSLHTLDAMGLIHPTAAMCSTCRTGIRQWALLQDITHVRTMS